ncbi:MAG: PLDc N-terminal domain-containing protein [Pseudomonadota bacterium]
MPIILATIACQIICVIHAIKQGRNQVWIMLIVFVPMIGCIAYFVVEVMPDLRNDRRVRGARAKAAQALDPQREVRAARAALDLADTAANRLRLGDALAALGRHEEAITFYRESIRMTAGEADPRTQGKLATSLYESGQGAEALALLDAVAPPAGQSERDRQLLLRGKILEHLGRRSEALALYEDVVTRLPGEEARCRYAALLIAEGWDRKAMKVLEEVEQRMKHLDRHQRAAEADMYRWAGEALAALRARA